jgi:hypothetical protein
MKYLTEYRDPELATAILNEIKQVTTKTLDLNGNLWWTNT